jgi:hypothetical protein
MLRIAGNDSSALHPNRFMRCSVSRRRNIMRRTQLQPILLGLVLSSILIIAPKAEDDFTRWPVLVNPFESTSGGGVMIDKYAPVVANGLCKTDFSVMIPGPQGGTFLNEAEFDAVPVQAGILCTNGRWRSKDGSQQGTTPFRVFMKDGIARRPPA